MPQLIKRYTRYRNHLAPAVPRHFVCACCGGKVVEQWHAEGSLIVCAGDMAHEGLMTECDWMEAHPPKHEEIVLSKETKKALFEEE